jgi:hypothetical protein
MLAAWERKLNIVETHLLSVLSDADGGALWLDVPWPGLGLSLFLHMLGRIKVL